MRIIEISALTNGAHRNQSFPGFVPDGWAVIPDELETPNFPFGTAEVEEIDGLMTVTAWTAGTIPEPDPQPEPTPEQQRENAYNTEKVISWDEKLLTVTEAALQWQYYAAEGSSKADQLTALISAAKVEIRERFPDEEESA